MDATIRQATKADASAIAQVQVASWLAAYDQIVPAIVLAAQSVERQKAFWSGALAQRLDNVFVAVNSQENVIAWVSFGRYRKDQDAKHKGEIYAIYARPDYFHSGVGRLLWLAAGASLRKSGYRLVLAWVVRDNKLAREFYERVGFSLVPDSDSTFNWEGVQIADVCYEHHFADF